MYDSSLISDWRRQHRPGPVEGGGGTLDGGRAGGPSLSEVAKLRTEKEGLRSKLAKAEVRITGVQGKARPPTSRARRGGCRHGGAGVGGSGAPPGPCRPRALAGPATTGPGSHRCMDRASASPRPRPGPGAGDEEAEAIVVGHTQLRAVCDQAPAQVWATLPDEGTYLASVSTMYRVLRARAQVRERRRNARRPAQVKPELVATGPNQVWSWDTKLADPLQLATPSAGWCSPESRRLPESSSPTPSTARAFPAGQLSLQRRPGTSMTSKTVTRSWPTSACCRANPARISTTTPYSEANFKTLKYFPTFPRRFPALVAAGGLWTASSPTTTTLTAIPASPCTPWPMALRRAQGGSASRRAPLACPRQHASTDPGRRRSSQNPGVSWALTRSASASVSHRRRTMPTTHEGTERAEATMTESPRGQLTLPDELYTRLLVGEASFALALLKTRREFPTNGRQMLRRLGEVFVESIETLRPSANSLSDAANHFELLLATNAALHEEEQQQLENDTIRLGRELISIASTDKPEAIPDADLDRLYAIVAEIENAFEMRASTATTDEVTTTPPTR